MNKKPTTFTYGFNKNDIGLIKKQLSEKTLSLDECNLLREQISLLESIENPQIDKVTVANNVAKEQQLLQLDLELYEYKKMIYKMNKEDDLFLKELDKEEL